NGRHLRQPAESARPTRLPAGDVAIVRFDGIKEHLRAIKQNKELESFTVFIVAAPRHNLGGFRALFAFNAPRQRDYTSGLNVDFGPGPSPRFSVLNVEGRGFGGAANLRKGDSPFPSVHTLELSSDARAKIVSLSVDGKHEGQRPRDGMPISMDEITVG